MIDGKECNPSQLIVFFDNQDKNKQISNNLCKSWLQWCGLKFQV